MSEDNVILTPDEVAKRRAQRVTTIKPETVQSEEKPTFFNRGGRVAINYETMGRFNIPATLYFKDYSVEDENSLILTRQEDLIETAVAILNTLKNQDVECKVEDMTLEEFLETLIGIEKQFDSTQHTHTWICNCQNELEDNDQKMNETIIDLNKLQYKSIEESDKILKGFYTEIFSSMSDKEWKEYLYKRYKNEPLSDIDTYTKEQELERIKLKEPFQVNVEDHSYTLRFTRIGDLIKARKIATEKFSKRIKAVQNRKEPNAALAGLRDQKKEEIEKLKYEEVKFIILAAEALSLISMDGKVLSDDEKINIYSNLPRNIKKEIKNFMEQFQIGIQHEQEFVCPLCGKTDKRLLQQEFSLFEFLPSSNVAKRKPAKSSGINFLIGI